MRVPRLLLWLTDWAIPLDIREFQQSEDIEHARMVCSALLLDIALMVVAGVLAPRFELHADWLPSMLIRLTLGLLVTHTLTLVIFRRTARFGLTASLYTGSTFVIYLANLLTVPLEMLPILLIPILAIPLFATVIGGLKAGLLWVVVVTATPAAVNLIWSQLLGQAAPIPSFFLGVWMVPNISVGFALWCFEHTAKHMRHRLDEECARFAFDAGHDSLTGLANRSVFERRLSEAIEHARFNHDTLTLLYIDLNDFKPINDQHGHHAGDALLTAIGQRLTAIVRQSDTVARLGGDEFVVLYRHLRRGSHLDNCVARVHEVIAEPVAYDAGCLRVSASIGVVCYPDDGDNASALQQRADALMYEAKQHRKTSAAR